MVLCMKYSVVYFVTPITSLLVHYSSDTELLESGEKV